MDKKTKKPELTEMQKRLKQYKKTTKSGKVNVKQALQMTDAEYKAYQRQKAQLTLSRNEQIENEVIQALHKHGYHIEHMTANEQLAAYYSIMYDSNAINAIIFNTYRRYNNDILTIDDIKNEVFIRLSTTKQDLKLHYLYRYVKYFANDACKVAINQYRTYMGNAQNIDTENENADFLDSISYQSDCYRHMDDYNIFTMDFLQSLKNDKQRQFVWAIHDGYTCQQIEKALGINYSRMKKQIARQYILYCNE